MKRKVVKTDVCISVAGAIAESYLECGHVIRLAGLKAFGQQGTKQRECPKCETGVVEKQGVLL